MMNSVYWSDFFILVIGSVKNNANGDLPGNIQQSN